MVPLMAMSAKPRRRLTKFNDISLQKNSNFFVYLQAQLGGLTSLCLCTVITVVKGVDVPVSLHSDPQERVQERASRGHPTGGGEAVSSTVGVRPKHIWGPCWGCESDEYHLGDHAH